jgi:hypothetical protein
VTDFEHGDLFFEPDGDELVAGVEGHAEFLSIEEVEKLIAYLKGWVNERQNAAEAAYERSQEGECFRGGEAAAYASEQQEAARRLK